MTATSPYAPRRQSSSISASGNNVMIRRSSSGSAVGAVASGTLLWALTNFWRRTLGQNQSMSLRDLFHALTDVIESSFTVTDSYQWIESGDSLLPRSRQRKGIAAVLRWVIEIIGGDRSKLGRLFVRMVAITREILTRSIGVTSVLLTGVPSRQPHEEESIRSLADGAMFVSPATNFENNTNLFGSEETSLLLVRKDRCEIDQVLHYWFGQSSPDGAQKSLWMIASSSQELLDKVDSEISKRFRALLWELSCSSKDESDKTICDFGLDSLTSDRDKLVRWTSSLFGWQGKVAAIIVLDQMSRHIHRHDAKSDTTLSQSHIKSAACYIPQQIQLDKIAFNVSKQLQIEHGKELSTGMVPIPMRIFGIMPLRHASTIENLTLVQHDVESAASLHDEIDRMIRRFRKATNRRMNILQDEARREGKLGSLDFGESNGVPHYDSNLKEFDDEQILESFPFDADMSNAHEHVIVKTIRNFLRVNNVLQSTDPRFNSSRKVATSSRDAVTTYTKNTEGTEQVPTAIVSLSGGVDSMVIASALAYIRDTEASKRNIDPCKVLRITAIHIDYGNRPESGAEASFVGRYSKQLGAKFVCRKIDEVTRGVTARDDYERIAREIRFELYRQCSLEAAKGFSNMTNEGNVGVMLGHHRGDLRENVISNAHKGCGPLELSGMTSVSKNDGVTLFRPLLPLEKVAVFDYAHTYGVPYFKDTTPYWSTRGKLRNRLLPLLEEIYGEGSMDNLSSLAEESDDAKALVQQTATRPFMNCVKYYPMGLSFETSQWKEYGLFFWKFILRNVLHSAGRGMFSDKSVESFLERIRAPNLKEGWLQCRKDYAVYMKQGGTILVFHPDSFPFHKKDHYQLPTSPVDYGHVIEVGPWSIEANVVKDESETVAEKLLKERVFESMELLMQGNIEYHLQLPISDASSLPNQLVFIQGYTKATRPAAWKNLDLKIEQTLPLLGVDNSRTDNIPSNDIVKYGKTWVLGKVRLTLNKSRSSGHKSCQG